MSMRPSPEVARVAASIRRGMAVRGMRPTELAVAVGVTPEAVSGWVRGRYLPSLENATLVTDVLDAPMVLHFARLAQVGTCRLCKAPFKKLLGSIRTRREYCSVQCRYRWNDGHRASVDHPAETAIAAFCHGCEPEGICRTSDCALRAFSPFMFVARRAA